MKVSNIDGWPCYYISKSGRLYSNKRGKWIRIRGELCNNRLQYRLYKRINTDLLGNKKHSWGIDTSTSRWFKASRLVAMAYIPNPHNYPIVCHKDNNPTNDYYKNLYWGTPKENLHQMIRDGRWYTPFTKESNPNKGKRGWQLNTSLNEQQFRSILKLKEAGYTNTVIIQKLGLTKISSSGISRIWKKYKVGYYDEVLKL